MHSVTLARQCSSLIYLRLRPEQRKPSQGRQLTSRSPHSPAPGTRWTSGVSLEWWPMCGQAKAGMLSQLHHESSARLRAAACVSPGVLHLSI